MPYQRLLEQVFRSVPGVLGALLLDPEGEVVLEVGAGDFRHRLIAAYQGIALSIAREVCRRNQGGAVRSVLCRYERVTVVVRSLRDGYFLVVTLVPGSRVAQCAHVADEVQARLDEEL